MLAGCKTSRHALTAYQCRLQRIGINTSGPSVDQCQALKRQNSWNGVVARAVYRSCLQRNMPRVRCMTLQNAKQLCICVQGFSLIAYSKQPVVPTVTLQHAEFAELQKASEAAI